MAKRKYQSEQPDYEDVEPVVDEQESAVTDEVPAEGTDTVTDSTNWTIAPLADVPYAPDPAAPRYAVSLTLPYGVLVAVLDSEHPDADVRGALYYGLIGAAGEVTPMGEKVAAGFDRTAVGHKMATAYRNAHNAALDAKK
jgi:hypothetical protein